MKATLFNTIVGGNWFTQTIFQAQQYMATVSSFIIAALRKTPERVSVAYIDRSKNDISDKGRVVIKAQEGAFVNMAAVANMNAVKVFDFEGVKDDQTRDVKFGCNGVPAADIQNALKVALDGVGYDLQIGYGLENNNDVHAAIREVIAPTPTLTSLKGALDAVFDLIPKIRPLIAQHTERIVVTFHQYAQYGKIEVWVTANEPNFDAGSLYVAEVSAPEVGVAVGQVSRDFGE